MSGASAGNLVECRGAKKYTYHLNNIILFDRHYCLEAVKIGENQAELRVGECVRDKGPRGWMGSDGLGWMGWVG